MTYASCPTSIVNAPVEIVFGITVREDLSCVPIGQDQCRVNYHCGFGYPAGWRGAVARFSCIAKSTRVQLIRSLAYNGPQKWIAIVHRYRETDSHADVVCRPRHLGCLARQVGEPLRAGVVHHHGADGAKGAAREGDDGGQVGIKPRE